MCGGRRRRDGEQRGTCQQPRLLQRTAKAFQASVQREAERVQRRVGGAGGQRGLGRKVRCGGKCGVGRGVERAATCVQKRVGGAGGQRMGS
eukprot:150946-Chlamydomonas_euryale.AAC.1